MPVRYRSSLEGESNPTDPALLERAASAALSWPDGTWSFAESDDAGSAIDPVLLPELKPLRALWTEVRNRIDTEEAARVVSAADAGEVQPLGSLAGALTSFGIEGPLAGIAEHLTAEGCAVDELFRRTQDKTGHLLHLLWLLETIGLVRRSGRETDPVLSLLARGELAGEEVDDDSEEQKIKKEQEARDARNRRSQSSSGATKPRYVAASSGIHTKPSPETLAKLPGLLKTARKHRIQKNFYEFFDLKADASRADVEASYKRLAQLWRGAAQTTELPEAARKDAHDLVQGALIAWKILSDPEKRAEYDKRLRQGRAPTLESQIAAATGATSRSHPGTVLPTGPAQGARTGPGTIPPRSTPGRAGGGSRPGTIPPGQTKEARARRLVDKADFAHALPLLRELRLENPSDPDVLADLGWTTWRLKGAEDAESANEYLQLALTFDPTHNRGMQYLARVAKEGGHDTEAKRLVERLLAIDPGDEWASRALQSFTRDEAATGRRGKKRGR